MVIARGCIAAMCAALLAACQVPMVESLAPPPPALEAKVAEAGAEHGIALFVTGRGLSQPQGSAAGFADREARRPMTVDTPLRIASNTKTFVAATALRLWEEGKLDLDSPIAPLLTPALDALIRADGFDSSRITVRQVMSHSAGFYDHGSDPRYIKAIAADPGHRWTREEQVRRSMEWGQPLGAPGEAFRYSDTGYILLGDIVERAAGEPLPRAVRRYLKLDRLGLRSTWWEIAEPPQPGAEPRARQFVGEQEGTGWSATMDLYGGGGLVMSARDLATFFAALFEGKVFKRPGTLAEMQWLGPHRNASRYRLGLFADTAAGTTAFWHGGFWGTVVYYSPITGRSAAAFATNTSGYGKARALAAQAVGVSVSPAARRAP